jgi:hypothetical protein
MEHGIPEGKGYIIGTHLSQYLGCENEKQHEVFQGIGNVDTGIGLDYAGDGKQNQGQKTKKYILIVTVENLGNHNQEHKPPQEIMDNHG